MKNKETKMPLVYICSPYAGDVEKNVEKARAYSRFAVEQNVIPMTPHLLYPQFMDDTVEKDKVKEFNYVLLETCQELWVFGSIISKGMAREIRLAKRRKLPMRWFDENMKEVPENDL